ncbi:MAG: tetratricopeptide repeat protein [Chitinophagaceae bacterium]
MRTGLRIAITISFAAIGFSAIAQPKGDVATPKPKQFEEHKLGSEKMADKKFTVPRHFFQNMYTHYNFYFNAWYKMKDIIDAAKTAHKENYTKLLPFYNYSLDVTSKNTEIDSIIQKCTAGILLHDLRNDWIDNLYLLIGKAYLLRKEYDSASMTFQYINYTFSPKEKDGYDRVIGSNSNEEGSALSIATKEKTNLYKKIIELPPSRNESFIWQIRTYSEKEEFIDAASLITTLKNDPVFPKRLKEELAEVEAYNYYKQGIYDSSAKYLEKAVSDAANKTEKARWYYLIGQMYQSSEQLKAASDYFAKCASTTIDPVMEVYARLASVRLRKNEDPKVVQQNIDEMVKMAKKEKYEFYRDIIYYAAGLSELERSGYEKAEEFLKKSIKYNTDNPTQKSQSFLVLADMAYDLKQYGKAGNLYDSVNTSDLDSLLVKRIDVRKPGAKIVYEKDRIIFAQDSLLKIAGMPETERNTYVRALAKRLRKERGLKDVVDSSNTGLSVNATQIGKGPDNIFTTDKGDFYFYNASQKSNGFQTFKQKWGARPNVDNWRRSGAIQIGFAAAKGITPVTDVSSASPGAVTTGTPLDINLVYNPTEFTFDALSSNLPVEKEKENASNKSINDAMLAKGKALQDQIEDLPEAIKVYEALLARLGKDTAAEEVIFNLVYCYNKTGQKARADEQKSRLNTDYKDGDFAKKINMPVASVEKVNPAATARYKDIYNLFIEGDFEKAVAEKQKADSTFGPNFWTPQLLYIESVYYIKQRQDTTAIARLGSIVSGFPGTPLAIKAAALIDVVKRRKEIEEHLTNLIVVRATDSTAGSPTFNAPPPTTTKIADTSRKTITPPATAIAGKTPPAAVTPKVDSTSKAIPLPNAPFVIDSNAAHMAVILLDKVDVVYLNESLNAFNRYNGQNLRTQKFELQKMRLDNQYALVTINSVDFTNAAKAMAYISIVKPKAATGIVPWLDAARYSFIIISQPNLDLLKSNLKVLEYLKTLKAAMPGKF